MNSCVAKLFCFLFKLDRIRKFNAHEDVVLPLGSIDDHPPTELVPFLQHDVSVPSLDMGTMRLLHVPVKGVDRVSNILPALLVKVTMVQIHEPSSRMLLILSRDFTVIPRGLIVLMFSA